MVEFGAALFALAPTLIFSIFVNAPLLAANFNETPNPSKAPWYFLGLQELLTVFHPMVAGVTIPGIGLFFLMFIPTSTETRRRSPRIVRPVSLMTVHLMFWAVLTMIGCSSEVPDSTSSSLKACSSSCKARRKHQCHCSHRRHRPVAAVAVFSALKSRDADGAVGILSRETKSRDRESTVLGDEDALTGKQVERAQVLERKAASKELVLAARESAPPAPYVPPDPEVIGVSRRQFFNRTIILMMQIGLGGFGLASIAFLWPQLGGGFGSAIRVGLVSDVLSEIRGANGFLYRAEGRMWITEYPNGAVEKARAAYSANELTGMESGLALGLDGGVIAFTRSARTSAAACPSASPPSGSSAPATVPSTTVSVKSVVARPHAAWIVSP